MCFAAHAKISSGQHFCAGNSNDYPGIQLDLRPRLPNQQYTEKEALHCLDTELAKTLLRGKLWDPIVVRILDCGGHECCESECKPEDYSEMTSFTI
jgi:hypothetical protein